MNASNKIEEKVATLQHCIQQDRKKKHLASLVMQSMDANPFFGFAIVDLDGTILDVNKYLCRVVGMNPNELKGRKFVDITHPDDAAKDSELFESLKRGEIEFYEMNKRYKYGKLPNVYTNHVHLMVYSVHSPEGLFYVVGMITTAAIDSLISHHSFR